jgi:hypothetical protein
MMTDTIREHRPRLFALAYRMLGSATDAEDVLQEPLGHLVMKFVSTPLAARSLPPACP